jgi:hypothetical protein
MFMGIPDPHPNSSVRGTDQRRFGSAPKCHGSPTLVELRYRYPVILYGNIKDLRYLAGRK